MLSCIVGDHGAPWPIAHHPHSAIRASKSLSAQISQPLHGINNFYAAHTHTTHAPIKIEPNAPPPLYNTHPFDQQDRCYHSLGHIVPLGDNNEPNMELL